MNILITGGYGYIGKSLYESLKHTHSVTRVGRREMDLTHSASIKRFLKNQYFDVVIHCAVVGGSRLKVDTWKDCDENLMMYYNLLQHRDYFGKMIHFGSGAELYSSDQPYGFSKFVIRNSILHVKDFYNIRIFGVFDENELDTRFIKANIRRYLNNEPIVIYKNREMDMFYMQDLITLVKYYICNDNVPKEIDCAYDQTKTLIEIANSINQLSDHRCGVMLQSQENDFHYKGKYLDLDLDFVGLEEGIKRTYRNMLEKIKI